MSRDPRSPISHAGPFRRRPGSLAACLLLVCTSVIPPDAGGFPSIDFVNIRAAGRTGCEGNAFYIDGIGPYYPSAVRLQVGASSDLLPGVAIEAVGYGEASTDLGASDWSHLDWYNNLIYGAGFNLFWDPRAQGLLGSALVEEVGTRCTFTVLGLDCYDRLSSSASSRPTSDVIGALSGWIHIRPGGRPAAGDQWINLRHALLLESGIGFRYSRSNLYFPGFENFYLFDCSALAFFGLFRSPRLGIQAGPTALLAVAQDLGTKPWNRSDWLNRIDAALGVRFQLRAPSFERVAGWQTRRSLTIHLDRYHRWYTDRGSFIPAFRPTADWRVTLTLDGALGRYQAGGAER